MNTKKILLSSAIATTMLISGIAMPTAYAANTNDVKIDGSATVCSYQNGNENTMSIMLKKGKNTLDTRLLTEKDLKELVEKKFTDTKVKSIDKKNGDNVGTGSVVTLNSDKKFTVVLYGDANKDGKVTLMDATLVARAAWNKASLDNAAKKAADVVKSSSGDITLMDATFISRLAWNQLGASNYTSFQNDIFPDDMEVVGVNDIIESNIEKVQKEMKDFCKLELKSEDKTVNIKVTNPECTVSNILDVMKKDGFTSLAKSILTDEIIKDMESVTLTYNDISYNFDLKNANDLNDVDTLIKSKIKSHQDKIDKFKDRKVGDICKEDCAEITVRMKLNGKNVVFGDDTNEITYTVCLSLDEEAKK